MRLSWYDCQLLACYKHLVGWNIVSLVDSSLLKVDVQLSQNPFPIILPPDLDQKLPTRQTLAYRVRNPSPFPRVLRLSNKSCSCLDVRVDGKDIDSGAEFTLSVFSSSTLELCIDASKSRVADIQMLDTKSGDELSISALCEVFPEESISHRSILVSPSVNKCVKYRRYSRSRVELGRFEIDLPSSVKVARDEISVATSGMYVREIDISCYTAATNYQLVVGTMTTDVFVSH
jgi:hypothetical protein